MTLSDCEMTVTFAISRVAKLLENKTDKHVLIQECSQETLLRSIYYDILNMYER